MTIHDFENVIKSIEVDVREFGKDDLSVLLKGRFLDAAGREHGVIRHASFIKCRRKGKNGEKVWIPNKYEGRQVYDASSGDVIDAECVRR